MIGKKIKVNDYKFTYGQQTVYLNVYGAFKYTKSGNKYVIYSYENDNNKLYYGSYFPRNEEAVIMISKENPKEIIKEFIELLLSEKENDKFKIISLEKIESVQIIDEHSIDYNVDTNKLYDLTIPKPVVESPAPEEKKPFSIATFFFGLFVVVVIAFFFVNPEVIMGENKEYSCIKSYHHDKIPAVINEELSLTFNGRGKIININKTSDYVFNDVDYYKEFKDKSYFYQYIEEGDTYKFDDSSYTYRLFSKIDTTLDFFLPTEESELISYYEGNNYTCKAAQNG